MNSTLVEVESLRKIYQRFVILSLLTFKAKEGEVVGIAGRNGAGKSTFMKILAGVLAPTAGSISFTIGGKIIPQNERFQCIGFVSPYLQLYEEFTGWENLDLCRKIRGIDVEDSRLSALLEQVTLENRGDDVVRTYSSGMKQRLKYACALLHQPPVLMLDEPTSNLDSEGCDIVRNIVRSQQEHGLTFIATNEPDELRWCTSIIDLNQQGSPLN